MNLNECFPPFFAILARRPGTQYKVFMNTIHQSFNTLGMPANILLPIANVSLGIITKTAGVNRVNHTFIKKWNGHTYRSCSWTHSGSDVELMMDDNTQVIPILNIKCEDNTLPFNSAVFTPRPVPVSNVHKKVTFVPRFPVSSKPIG